MIANVWSTFLPGLLGVLGRSGGAADRASAGQLGPARPRSACASRTCGFPYPSSMPPSRASDGARRDRDAVARLRHASAGNDGHIEPAAAFEGLHGDPLGAQSLPKRALAPLPNLPRIRIQKPFFLRSEDTTGPVGCQTSPITNISSAIGPGSVPARLPQEPLAGGRGVRGDLGRFSLAAVGA